MRILSPVLVSVLGFLLTLTGGCAFGTRHAVIAYPPELLCENSSPNALPAVNRRIAVLPFEDERANQRVVGYVLNGFGMRTAQVVSDTPNLGQVITDAVRRELQNSGYELVSASDPAAGDVTTLAGALTRVYCDAYFTYDGTVTLTVQFQRAGRMFYKKSYEGKGSVGMNWGATGDSYGRSLSLALADALEHLKRDLPLALQQYRAP